ncbi:MAG: ABC transporter ATP-binding protein [Actinomycetes bacterium]
MSSLELMGISKRFGGVKAVDDVSMLIPAGRITGLIGPNGAGKTTLVNIISGFINPTEGKVRFSEHDLTGAPAHVVAQMGIIRTFQNIRLLSETSVIENIAVGFHRHARSSLMEDLLGTPKSKLEHSKVRESALNLLERFEMLKFAESAAGDLAYGHQRQVEVMRALGAGPSVLMLDEPVAGMNDVEAGKLAQIFKGLAKDGMGILLIEHNVRFVSQLCSYVYVINNGSIISEGAPERVTRDPAVIEAYLGIK